MNSPGSIMDLALEQARIAYDKGEVPVGAVIVDGDSGNILAKAHNVCETECDPTAHAEILAIRAACNELGSNRLINCDLYATLEPCAMCAAAIAFARIRRLVFGAYDAKGGGVEHGSRFFSQATCHHKPEIIGGIAETNCSSMLQEFFKNKRS